MDQSVYQITSPYFCAGVLKENGIIVKAAPIVKYMRGWPIEKVRRYCIQKGWKLEYVEGGGA